MLKVEPLVRSAGNVYFAMVKTNSGRAFEKAVQTDQQRDRARYDDVPDKRTRRRKWRQLTRGQMMRVKTLGKQLSA